MNTYDTIITPPTDDDTATIQAVLDAGGIFTIPHKTVCRITQSLVITKDYSGIVSDGSGVLYMPASCFNTISLAFAERYGPQTVGVYIHGLLEAPWTPVIHPVLKGVRIIGEAVQGLFTNPVVVQNAQQVKIIDNEIANFSLGVGIRIQSCTFGSVIERNYIHDFLDNTTGWNNADVPQITGIEIDNDIWNNLSSDQLSVCNNTIRNMLVGSDFLYKYGYQTDGINVVRNSTFNTTILGNHIDTCAEGIDNFGSHTAIANNVIINAYNFGIKMIHGASFASVVGNVVTMYGLAGIVCSGSPTINDPCVDDVVISGNNVSFGNYGGNWGSQDNAAIMIGLNGTAPPVNIFVTGNILRPANGNYALNITPNSGVTIGSNLAFPGLLGVSR